MKFYTYILKSLKDNKYYYGHTQNINERLQNHNSGKVKSTKNRKPFVVIYKEEFNSKSEAYKREIFFKSYQGYIYLKSKCII